MTMALSERAHRRSLVRAVDEAARRRFGRHAAFRVYCDTSDGDPEAFDACLQYTRRPAGASGACMFPAPPDRVLTAPTAVEALSLLLNALLKKGCPRQ